MDDSCLQQLVNYYDGLVNFGWGTVSIWETSSVDTFLLLRDYLGPLARLSVFSMILEAIIDPTTVHVAIYYEVQLFTLGNNHTTQETWLRLFIVEVPGTFWLLCLDWREVNSFAMIQRKTWFEYASSQSGPFSTSASMGRDAFRAPGRGKCWRSHVELWIELFNCRLGKVEKVASQTSNASTDRWAWKSETGLWRLFMWIFRTQQICHTLIINLTYVRFFKFICYPRLLVYLHYWDMK